MIQVIEAKTPKEMKTFVTFPFKLYKDNPYWVPPIIKEELESFDSNKNPVFENAEAKFYLAYQGNTIVGRIAAIINWQEVNLLHKYKVRFGWWETIDDIEVTKALLQKVYELGKQHNMQMVEGPMGFSNLDKVGVLTEGFNELGNMITWYSPPYYQKHLEELGFVKEKEYIESIFSMTNVNPEAFRRAAQLVQKKYNLTSLHFKSSEQIMPYVDKMFELFNHSYSKLASFVPVSEKQIAYFKKKYVPFINPEYIKFVVDNTGQMIAFTIVMPSFSEALQKSKGKLFPLGWYHLLQAKKHSKDVVFYLIGIDPAYQNKGVTAIIFNDYYDVFQAKGIQNCIRTPELEENHAMHNLWKNFNPIINKRRRTYSKPLS